MDDASILQIGTFEDLNLFYHAMVCLMQTYRTLECTLSNSTVAMIRTGNHSSFIVLCVGLGGAYSVCQAGTSATFAVSTVIYSIRSKITN